MNATAPTETCPFETAAQPSGDSGVGRHRPAADAAQQAAADHVRRVFRELDRLDIRYCVLRGGHDLQQLVREREIDVLIDPIDLKRLDQSLSSLGFVRLRSWGHRPHQFFVHYDADSDSWLKLDVVTSVCYGRPVHNLRTQLARRCLKGRHRNGWCQVPSPEDELMTLLLHCAVDRGDFPVHWCRRLQALRNKIGAGCQDITRLIHTYWSNRNGWEDLSRLIESGEWEKLIARRPDVVQQLAANRRSAERRQWICDRLLRKSNRIAEFLRPRSLRVALLAPDGGGKSTIAASLAERFYFPVRRIYMGLYPAASEPVRTPRIPGMGLLAKLVTQWWRYAVGGYHRARGRFVIFDRYSYDSLLPSEVRRGRISRLRRWLLGNLCPAPDLVIVLDAPGEVLFARKGEHSIEHLERQRQAYLGLQNRLKRVDVVDATGDLNQVRRHVTASIWRHYTQRFR